MSLNKGPLSQYVKYRSFFLMLIPVFAYFGLFHYGPMYGIVIAFKDFYPLKGIMGSPWAGLEHFQEIFDSLFFKAVLKNTLIISFSKLIFGFPAPILLAILLNEVRNLRYKKLVQSVTYLPHFISWVVLAGMVIELFSPSRGPINIVLQNLNLEPIFFIAEPDWFRKIVVGSGIWRELGWSSIIYLAAITGIDPELYDVAELDGAGRFRKIINITLPCMAPVIIIMFIFATGSIINDDFDQTFNLLNSKVMDVGDVLSTYTFREGLQRMNYSYATAVGLFKNIVAFSLVMLTNAIAKRTSDYSIL
ncbi:MAG: sugar ABC transporter permease [Clostridia bacterium]|nr:sugar ABC transporter permease [Clostridia bacterium]NCC75933.1 sugar ABC transporter permease [Clostridia bacterium]